MTINRRVTRVLCAANPEGSHESIEALHRATEGSDVHALALVGNLAASGDADSLRSIFKALARSGRPAYWVPGWNDAPIDRYLREAANIEVVAPFLRGVHGTGAFADGHVVFAGMGGEVSDDPDAQRDETERLRYPRWEPEYHLKVLRELDEHQLVMMFCTPPAHKGTGTQGAEILAELVATHRPRMVVSGGEQRTEMIGRALIVAPGKLSEGHYAIADINSHEVQFEQLSVEARAS